ncbi:MAG: MFS transporter [Pyrinomonadaceae bacterium]
MNQARGSEEITEPNFDTLPNNPDNATPETDRQRFNFSSPLLVIFVTVLIDLIGFGIVIPVLPYYAEAQAFQATPFEIGLLTSSYSAMQFIFSPILGQLSDRYGRRPILFFSLLGTSLGFLIVGVANTLVLLFVGRILDGMTGGNISTAQAYIADVTTPENRAKGMGMIGAAFGLGFVFGPVIGGLLSKVEFHNQYFNIEGIQTPFLFAALLALGNATLLYFVLPETVKFDKTAAPKPIRSRFSLFKEGFANRNLAIVIVLYFLVVTAFSMMTTAFILYTMYRFGYDAVQNGFLFMYIGILGAVFQGVLFGRLAKRFGESRLVLAGALIMGVAFVFVPIVSPTVGGLTGLLIGIAAFAIGNSLATPSLTSLGSKFSPPDSQGTSLGVLQSSASLARAGGPALAGLLLYSATAASALKLDDASLYRTFWTAAGIMFSAVLLAVYFVRKTSQLSLS